MAAPAGICPVCNQRLSSAIVSAHTERCIDAAFSSGTKLSQHIRTVHSALQAFFAEAGNEPGSSSSSSSHDSDLLQADLRKLSAVLAASHKRLSAWLGGAGPSVPPADSFLSPPSPAPRRQQSGSSSHDIPATPVSALGRMNLASSASALPGSYAYSPAVVRAAVASPSRKRGREEGGAVGRLAVVDLTEEEWEGEGEGEGEGPGAAKRSRYAAGEQKHAAVPMETDEELAARLQREEEEEAEARRLERQRSEDKMLQELLEQEAKCLACHQIAPPDEVIYLESCQHRCCHSCLRKRLQRVLAQSSLRPEDLRCLSCPFNTPAATRLPPWAIKRVLSPAECDKLQQLELKAYIAGAGANVTICPNPDCGTPFEAVAGTVSQDASMVEMGLDGKPASLAALQHKAKHRLRCTKCQTVFCGGCRLTPYHIGFSCEEYTRYQESSKCRFCTAALTPANSAPPLAGLSQEASRNLPCCNTQECMDRRAISCTKTHPNCGHACGGIKKERQCLPCLEKACAEEKKISIDKDEFCSICWVEPLGSAPSVQLSCGHFYHYTCLKQKIEKGWPGARITFGFLNCPQCKQQIDHPSLKSLLQPNLALLEDIKGKCKLRLDHEGLQNDRDIVSPQGRYYKNPIGYALDRFAFYPCSKCKKPFYGGMRQCEEAAQQADEKFNPNDLVCGGCVAGKDAKSCKLHGKEYIEHKCRFCCNIATWFCWGSTHFCDTCHKRQEKGDYLTKKSASELPRCPGVGKGCPIGIDHPPPGKEFPLGCGICRPRHC